MNLSKFKSKPKHKIVIGAVEPIIIEGKKYKARIDTGAARSSICTSLIDKINFGSPVAAVETRSTHGKSSRLVFIDCARLKALRTFRPVFAEIKAMGKLRASGIFFNIARS